MATSVNKRLSKKKKETVQRERDYIINYKFSMKPVSPKTVNQSRFMEQYALGKNVAAIGSAGTGKTYLAMYLAMKDVLKEDKYREVIVIRSAVQTRDQGYMPGNQAEKAAVFESPYIDIINDLFENPSAYGTLKANRQIRFMTSSFVRGLTFNNAIIIVDECQSMSAHELNTIAQRVGEDSRIIWCGDTKQNDLIKSKYDTTGLPRFLKVCERIPSVSQITFTVDDCVRSGFCKEFILADEETI